MCAAMCCCLSAGTVSLPVPAARAWVAPWQSVEHPPLDTGPVPLIGQRNVSADVERGRLLAIWCSASFFLNAHFFSLSCCWLCDAEACSCAFAQHSHTSAGQC